MHLHDFLSQVHLIVNPVVYLEVGVQYGTSLRRAEHAQVSIGIDPNPLVEAVGHQHIYKMTADDYFDRASDHGGHPSIDFGFIDGMHHYEVALRDFLNIERFVTERSVVIFDDVLPRNQHEAARDQCPGDWTGDVWKVTHLLLKHRPDLTIREVNTDPTGTLLVYGFKPLESRPRGWHQVTRFVKDYRALTEVPQATLDRAYAISVDEALDELRRFLK
jgi:hypothetical protein